MFYVNSPREISASAGSEGSLPDGSTSSGGHWQELTGPPVAMETATIDISDQWMMSGYKSL